MEKVLAYLKVMLVQVILKGIKLFVYYA